MLKRADSSQVRVEFVPFSVQESSERRYDSLLSFYACFVDSPLEHKKLHSVVDTINTTTHQQTRSIEGGVFSSPE